MEETAAVERMAQLEAENEALRETCSVLEQQLKEMEQQMAQMQEDSKAEEMIRQMGGKNTKAILALCDRESGLSWEELLAKVQEEAPYLFYEKRAAVKGTGVQMGKSREKEEKAAAQFRKGLRRRG